MLKKSVLINVLFILITSPIVRSAFSADLDNLHIIIPNDVAHDYALFLGKRDVRTLKSYKGDYSRRDVVEVVLIQRALYLAGFSGRVILSVAPTSDRIRRDIKIGVAAATGTSDWSIDYFHDEDFMLSSPLVRDKEFVVGIYHSSDFIPPKKFSLAHLQSSRVLSNKAWVNDWKTLEELRVTELVSVPTWISMLKMLQRGRASYTLAPFSNKSDLSVEQEGVHLMPVWGVKVGIRGTRHFVVSKKYPEGAKVLELLNRGIAELRKLKEIERAYTESGFFNTKTNNWKLIN